MKLLITRHGKTKENIAGIVMGHSPGELSDEGIAHAQELKNMLKKYQIDVIYSSDLKRCVETSNILNSKMNLELRLDKRLRELNFGDIQRHSRDSGKDNIDYLSNLNLKFPNGESNQELIDRVVNCINEIYNNHTLETVLVVSHSGPLAVIKSSLEGIDYRVAIENKIDFNELEQYSVNDYLKNPT